MTNRKLGGGTANQMRALRYQVLPPNDPEDCTAWEVHCPGEDTVLLAKDEAEGWKLAEIHWYENAVRQSLAPMTNPKDMVEVTKPSLSPHIRERDDVKTAIIAAYEAGALAVHENWQEDRDPDFTEAAHDYAVSIDIDAPNRPTPGREEIALIVRKHLWEAQDNGIGAEQFADAAADAILALFNPTSGER